VTTEHAVKKQKRKKRNDEDSPEKNKDDPPGRQRVLRGLLQKFRTPPVQEFELVSK
jgi:hypothetical protein